MKLIRNSLNPRFTAFPTTDGKRDVWIGSQMTSPDGRGDSIKMHRNRIPN
jgi:hypothetical protein